MPPPPTTRNVKALTICYTTQFVILLTRFWQFSVGFQVTGLISCVFEDHVSLCVLVVSQTKQNDVSRVDPHLNESKMNIIIVRFDNVLGPMHRTGNLGCCMALSSPPPLHVFMRGLFYGRWIRDL